MEKEQGNYIKKGERERSCDSAMFVLVFLFLFFMAGIDPDEISRKSHFIKTDINWKF
jgi:hypothetical protein